MTSKRTSTNRSKGANPDIYDTDFMNYAHFRRSYKELKSKSEWAAEFGQRLLDAEYASHYGDKFMRQFSDADYQRLAKKLGLRLADFIGLSMACSMEPTINNYVQIRPKFPDVEISAIELCTGFPAPEIEPNLEKQGLQGIEWVILRSYSGGKRCGEGLSWL